jgi:hypothetical protein
LLNEYSSPAYGLHCQRQLGQSFAVKMGGWYHDVLDLVIKHRRAWDGWILGDGGTGGGRSDSAGMNISIHTMAGGGAGIRNLARIAFAAALAVMFVASIGGVAIAAPAGSIGGCVQADNGTPISGAHVVAYEWETGMFVGEARTSEDGAYSIAGLALPRYGVKADAAGYLSEYYREGGIIPVVVLSPYATDNIDFTLTPGSSISGCVYRADGLTPIEAARVVAYQKVGGAWEYAADGYADSEGSYSITTGTGAGTYKVKAQAVGYAAEYYSRILDPPEVTEIHVSAGGAIAGVNFSLNQIGFISGTVYKADGVTPIPGVHIVAYDSATGGSVDEGFSGTNAGLYYINLSPGTYRLEAEGAGYLAEWYADVTTFGAATPVSVASLSEVPDINFTLETVMLITTLRAFDITETSARLTGNLTSLGAASEVVVSFVWGTAPGSYTHETPRQVRISRGYISFGLTGLAPGLTYYYMAKAVGDADPVYGGEKSFATIDETAPVMSESICRTTSSIATVTWTTDEPTTSQIDFGLTEDYGSTTGQSADLVTSHSVCLIELSANRTYHYRIICKDASGNAAVTEDYTFRTDSHYGGLASRAWKIVGVVVLAVVVGVAYVMIHRISIGSESG